MRKKAIAKKVALYFGSVLLCFFILGLLISQLEANIQESIGFSSEEHAYSEGEKVVAITKDGTKITQGKNETYRVTYEDGGYVLLKDMMNYTIGYSDGTKVKKTHGDFHLRTSNKHDIWISKDGSYEIKEEGNEVAKGANEGSVQLVNGDTHPRTSEAFLSSYLKENQLNDPKIYDAHVEDLRSLIQRQ